VTSHGRDAPGSQRKKKNTNEEDKKNISGEGGDTPKVGHRGKCEQREPSLAEEGDEEAKGAQHHFCAKPGKNEKENQVQMPGRPLNSEKGQRKQ